MNLTLSEMTHSARQAVLSVNPTALRSRLFGEYASLLILCHSVFGAVCWAVHGLQNPLIVTVMVLSGIWLAFRSVGGGAGTWLAALISCGVVVATIGLAITGVEHVPAWLSSSVVSPIVWMGMAIVLLITDLLDLRNRARAIRDDVQRRKLDGRLLKMTLAGLFLLWGVGVPVGTLIGQLNLPEDGKPRLEEMGFVAHVGFRCGEALVTACFLALGCNIGSFLNVVVWRMPRGRSIVYEKSGCPVCATAIDGRDNIPIFGWMGLGGQCRACGTDISSRYPTVEALTGGIFLLLYFVELISGGANLPFRGINAYRGVLWIIMYPKWDLIGLYLFHFFLFSMMLVWALMTIDGSRIPRRLLVFAFSLALALPVVFPDLALVSSFPSLASPTSGMPLLLTDRIVRGALGVIGGLLFGALVVRLLRLGSAEFSTQLTVMYVLALCGAGLGWQAAGCLAAGFFGVTVFRRGFSEDNKTSHPYPTVRDLLIVALCHHVLWRLIWTCAGTMV